MFSNARETMRFHFTRFCIHRAGISAMLRSIRAYTRIYIYMYVCIYVHSWWQRQMMHIKRSETRTRSPAGNNALMSRRRSDYGGFTLVIVISQRARVATLSFLSFHLEKLCARLNGNIFFLRFLLRLFRYNLLFRCLQLL